MILAADARLSQRYAALCASRGERRSPREANGQTFRPHLIIKTMCAAIVSVPENLLGFSILFDRDHLNAYRNRPLAFRATDQLREIDLFDNIGIFSRYFSQ